MLHRYGHTLTEAQDRQAACNRPGTPRVFFPGDGEGAKAGRDPARESRIASAKRICSTCPVTGPCLTVAIANREHHGVWGGVNFGQRGPMTNDPVVIRLWEGRGVDASMLTDFSPPGAIQICATADPPNPVAQPGATLTIQGEPPTNERQAS
jgi:hypothetical protein